MISLRKWKESIESGFQGLLDLQGINKVCRYSFRQIKMLKYKGKLKAWYGHNFFLMDNIK